MLVFNKKIHSHDGGCHKISEIIPRSEVKEALCWDLTSLFPNDQAWEESFLRRQAELSELEEGKGRLGESSALLLNILQRREQIFRELEKLYSYAFMKRDEDTTNSNYSALFERTGQLIAQASAAASWYEPEVLGLDEAHLQSFMNECEELAVYRLHFQRIRAMRGHLLSAAEETLLAGASEVFDSPARIFTILDNADQKFPSILDAEGEEMELSHSRFGKLMEDRDRRVREDAFKAYYSAYHRYRNTYAAALASQVKADNYLASVRHFKNAREAALFANHVPEIVYDQLLERIQTRIELLHRYTALRKKLLGLDELHSYDLYAKAMEDEEREMNFADACDILLAALAPLGKNYGDILKKAFSEGWIDRAENIGKRSGAYSGGCYDSKPYVLMTWQGRFSNLFTLAHELGHSVHSYLSRAKQPYTYGGYPIFLAEIASTTNENLLTDYLIKNSSDKKEIKRLSLHYLDGFKGTVFRQTQFAEFEWKTHLAEQQGQALTAQYLSDLYADLNRRYYGPHLCFDEEIALEWARIPHFYRNFYVFQYATGYAAATAFTAKILKDGEAALQPYLHFLASGSSADPLDTLLEAGLDMGGPQVVDQALDVFARYLDEVEAMA